tara:strand:+ start:1090 stop:1953 length:864 start_codon:yes stop_codon:yes gene_type:complete
MQEQILIPSDTEHPTKDELSALIRHLGHDYGGALTAINLSLEMWAAGLVPQMQIIEGAQDLVLKGQHVAHISGAIQALGRNRNAHGDFHLDSLVNGLVAYAQRKHDQLTFRALVHPNIEIQNSADVVYMQLLNFTQNAIDSYRNNQGHITQGGFVEIGAEILILRPEEREYLGRNKSLYEKNDVFVHAYVKDHGKGIPQKSKNVFNASTTSKTYGTGVGLALTDYVCDFLHGFVKVESEEDVGSTFSLYFPVEYKKGKKRRKIIPEQVASGIERIPIVGRLYKRLLK